VGMMFTGDIGPGGIGSPIIINMLDLIQMTMGCEMLVSSHQELFMYR
jgi:hypothetical protein